MLLTLQNQPKTAATHSRRCSAERLRSNPRKPILRSACSAGAGATVQQRSACRSRSGHLPLRLPTPTPRLAVVPAPARRCARPPHTSRPAARRQSPAHRAGNGNHHTTTTIKKPTVPQLHTDATSDPRQATGSLKTQSFVILKGGANSGGSS